MHRFLGVYVELLLNSGHPFNRLSRPLLYNSPERMKMITNGWGKNSFDRHKTMTYFNANFNYSLLKKIKHYLFQTQNQPERTVLRAVLHRIQDFGLMSAMFEISREFELSRAHKKYASLSCFKKS